jgi:hypothetical protein
MWGGSNGVQPKLEKGSESNNNLMDMRDNALFAIGQPGDSA